MIANHLPANEFVRFPLEFRHVEIVDMEDLGPRIRRFVFGGDSLNGFQSLGAGDHLKVIFPENPESAAILPEMGANGPFYPEGVRRPEMRDYTPRHFDPVANLLTIDFVLHGEGVATAWANAVSIGHSVGIAGPRGSLKVSADYDWYLLGGDETSIPSIMRQIELLPGKRITAYIEVTDFADEQPSPTRTADVVWLHRGEQQPGTTSLLPDAVAAHALPPGNGYIAVSGEANTLRPIRNYLLKECGLNPEHTHFSGHWKRNVRDWDHHEPLPD